MNIVLVVFLAKDCKKRNEAYAVTNPKAAYNPKQLEVQPIQ